MFKAYKRYADFNGRSNRSEYWLFTLFCVLVAVGYTILSIVLTGGNPYATTPLNGLLGVAYGIFTLGSLVPSVAVSVRRLHDTDRSGWFVLLGLIPLIGLILIYFFVQVGTKGPNKFGPDPLGAADVEVFS